MTEQQKSKQGMLANSTELVSQDEEVSNEETGKTSGEELLPVFNDRYQTIDFLGEGGMGTVFRVRERSNGSIFAMKLLKKELTSEKSALKRFEKEAEATSKLTHDNLVSVYDHGYTSDGVPYLIMDCVNGKNLGQIIKENGPFKIENAIDIAVQIGEALSYAHSRGIIHRDLKPSNIILETRANDAEQEAESLKVKIADFGIAVVANENAERGETITQTGALIGSPQYMSPEQCTGQLLDPGADIYSFGCVMYAMLTGKPPFDGGNPVQIILRQINEAPDTIPLKSNNSLMSKSIEAVILKCLEKNKNDRYKDFATLLIDLKRVRNGEKIRFVPRARAFNVSYKRLAVTMVLVVFVGVVSIISGYLLHSKQPKTIDKMPSNLHERAFVHFREKAMHRRYRC